MLKTGRLSRVLCIMVFLIVCPAVPAVYGQAKEKKPAKVEKKKSGKKKTGKKKSKAKAKKKAEKLHVQAVTFYKEGKYEEALELFQQADEILSNPVTMFNVARCHEKLGKYKEAYEYYRSYIESGDKTRREAALEAVKNIEEMPVKVKIKIRPRTAEVFMDGNPVEAKKTPIEIGVKAGRHTVFIRKEGYESESRELDIPYGGEAHIEVDLVRIEEPPEEEEGAKRRGKRGKIEVPLSIHFAAGATVSTSGTVTSLLAGNIGIAYRIREFSAGIGIDNMFFSNCYLLSAYPAGSYTLKVWKALSLDFAVGFGFAYLYSAEGGGNIESGSMWDLVVHVDAKARYKLGPVLVQAIPISVDVLVGAGSIKPAPLAQFALLVGVAYDF